MLKCIGRFLLVMTLMTPMTVLAQHFPLSEWEIGDTKTLGWSKTRLKKAEAYNTTIKTSAVMVVSQGKIIASWGETNKKFMCHSIRKSFLSVLFGIYVDQGKIDLDKSLASLAIDDKEGLTAREKKATTRQLLKARSGIYHPAAYESAGAAYYKPKRGAYKPGENWHYNNWDFNTLATIFNRETSLNLFEAFDHDIAKAIQMQDFNINTDTYYHYERDKSFHPAYPFEMTVRDMARFGLLVLNNGNWNGNQIVSRKWIEESTTSYSESGYGYMWWVVDQPHKAIVARGVGGHSIHIFPELDVVIVIRTNTYKREGISRTQSDKLIKLILDAMK